MSTAIITGGTSGIGFEIAKTLLQNSYSVVVCSRETKDVRAATASLSQYGNVFGVPSDVSKLLDCKHLLSFARIKLRSVDVLINCAAVLPPEGIFEQTNFKDWNENLEITAKGTFNMVRLTLPYMKKRKQGRIINFAGGGVGGSNPMPDFSAYYTAKSAIVGFTEAISYELKDNITINAISPGFVKTPMTVGIPRKESTPFSKITDLVLFLCSDESKNVNGRILSARWDSIKSLKKKKLGKDLYRLRRIIE